MDSKLLVLDLDETLVYTTEQALEYPHHCTAGKYFVYDRPHVGQFLEFCLKEFDLGVWTSSTENYAEEIVRHLFGDSKKLRFLWARGRCTPTFDANTGEHVHAKNLKKVKKLGFPLEQTIIIDDTPEKWEKQYGNLVRVTEFVGNTSDTELLDLIPYLKYLKNSPNVRLIEKRGWRSRTDWKPR